MVEEIEITEVWRMDNVGLDRCGYSSDHHMGDDFDE